MLKPSHIKAGLRPVSGLRYARGFPKALGHRSTVGSNDAATNPKNTPQLPSASPRDLRDQTVQRLQLGLFGLITMLLLVGLADIIAQHAHIQDSTSMGASNRQAASASASASDPLVDIGIAPSPEASSSRHSPVLHPATR